MGELWRAKIYAKELMDCGFDPSAKDGGWSVIQGILKAKGVPEAFIKDGAPFRATEAEDGIELELGYG